MKRATGESQPRRSPSLGRANRLRLLVAATMLTLAVAVLPHAGAVPDGADLTPAQRERLGALGGQRPRDAGPLTPAQAHHFLDALSALYHDRPADALESLEALVDRAGRADEWVLNAYGAALLGAGMAQQAVQVLGEALDRYPRNGYLHLNLAWARLALDRDIEAIPHLDSYLASEIAAHDPRLRRLAHLALARAHGRIGRIEERELALQAAFRDFPGDPWIAELLAEAAFERGDDEEYRRFATQAVQRFDAAHAGGPPFKREAAGTYRLPLQGPALVRRGFESDPGHRGLRLRYALELWPLDEEHLQPRPAGVSLQASPVEQWHGFAAPVLAAKAGTIVFAEDSHPDRRLTGLPAGLAYHPSNKLVLRHDDVGEVSIYYHLKQHSIRALGLAPGDTVAAGQPIGAVGANGTRTAFPCLRFVVAADDPEDELYRGLAFAFSNIERRVNSTWQPQPNHTIQTGDTLRAPQQE